MALRIRRGTDAQRTGKTFEMGEIVYTTDSQQIWVGDGSTQGGIPVVGPNIAGYGLVYNNSSHKLEVSGLTADDITNGVNNKFFSTEQAQDAAASLFTTGSHTNISFSYDDTVGKLNATVSLDGVGLTDIVNDTSPSLGGDLNLNNFNVTGTGNINTTGTLGVTGGLSSDLSLNFFDLTGPGNIATTGTITASLTSDSGAVITVNGVSGGDNTSSLISLTATRLGNAALQNNDVISAMTFDAWTGSVSKKAVLFESKMTSAIVNNNFNSKLSIFTLNSDGNYREFTFDQNGGFTTTLLALTGLSTAQVAGSGITPVPGAMTYNTDFKSFQVYNGTQFSTMLNLGVATAPANSSSTGVKGQTFVDNDWFYIATGTNSWRRVALNTF